MGKEVDQLARDTVTLSLDGPEVTLAQLVRGARSLEETLTGLEGLSGTTQVRWVVDSLAASSAIVGVRGVGPSEIVERVVDRYSGVARSLQRGRLHEIPSKVREPAEALVALLGETEIQAVILQTDEADYFVAPVPGEQLGLDQPPAEATRSLGEVRGHVETLHRRGRLRFTLYDLAYDTAVTCFLDEDQQELVRDLWGQLVRVVGVVTREPVKGRPKSVRQIQVLKRLDAGDPDGWRRLRGALPRVEGQPRRACQGGT